jgi:hypothetical protein
LVDYHEKNLVRKLPLIRRRHPTNLDIIKLLELENIASAMP